MSSEIVDYYERASETTRLASGSGLLEGERTREILTRLLPPPPAVVFDVGGGPGAYAGWLASRGYRVHLLDPVSKHLEQAQSLALAGLVKGDARSLPWPDAAADAVIILGPLYHLIEPSHRKAALIEARRVLRPGGVVAAAGISRWASLFHSLVDGFVDDDRFWPVLLRDLTEGIHRNDTGEEKYFTTAALHKPSELQAEIAEAGFRDVKVLGVEGPGWLAHDFDRRWQDPARRQRLLDLVRLVESETELAGASLHLIGSGRR